MINAIGTNCTYDANGNLIANGELSLVYDDENQLIQIINTNAAEKFKIVLSYDGLGRLRHREKYGVGGGAERSEAEIESDPGGGGISWLLQHERWYGYDGMLVIQELDQDLVPTVHYTRGTDLSGSLQGAGGIGGLLARTEANVDTFYHADGNGNITYLVDGNQALAASYRYDSFGNIISQSGDLADANLYRFSSKMFDPLSGLYYYGYRWYSPQLQRWMNRDPIFESGGINLYSYVLNDPNDLFDPFGLLDKVLVNKDSEPELYDIHVKYPTPKGKYGVGSHGNYKGQVVGPDKNPITPKDLADLIRQDPNYEPGTPVILYSCWTGADRGSGVYAEALAKELGVTVTAPTEFVWMPKTPDKKADVMGGKNNPTTGAWERDPSKVGKWEEFPKKKK